MTEEKLFRLLAECGVWIQGAPLSPYELRRRFGMRNEVAQKWYNVLAKLPQFSPFAEDKADAAAKRLREICLEFLNFYDAATDNYARSAAIQESIVNEQDREDDKIINKKSSMSKLPEAPSDDIDYEAHLTTEDLKNFIPTDGLS